MCGCVSVSVWVCIYIYIYMVGRASKGIPADDEAAELPLIALPARIQLPVKPVAYDLGLLCVNTRLLLQRSGVAHSRLSYSPEEALRQSRARSCFLVP